MAIHLCVGGRELVGAPVEMRRGRVWGPLVYVAERLGARVEATPAAIEVSRAGRIARRFMVSTGEPPPAADRLEELAWRRRDGVVLAPLDALTAALGAAWRWVADGEIARVVGPEPALAGCTVGIDAGHGGSDRGEPGTPLDEAALNLDVALRLADYLAGAGAALRLARTGDEALSASERLVRLDAPGPGGESDLALSIHQNGCVNPLSGGVEMYCNDWPEAERLAQSLMREWIRGVPTARSRLGPAPLELLRRARRPAVHIECGYLTHSADAVLLADPWGRERMAMALFRGLCRYLTERADSG
ncbi:MAG TPA: N-acetylmuramoyl-L-alanine amidase [Limnochordia bacterium]|nr:N-acetylmuramoyl-L-alanine amidase [Limnochordia bacterium]